MMPALDRPWPRRLAASVSALLTVTLASCGPPTLDAEYVPLDGSLVGSTFDEALAAYPDLDPFDPGRCEERSWDGRSARYAFRLPEDHYFEDSPAFGVVQGVHADCDGVVTRVSTQWTPELEMDERDGVVRPHFRALQRNLQGYGASADPVPDAEHFRWVTSYVDESGVGCELEHDTSRVSHGCRTPDAYSAEADR